MPRTIYDGLKPSRVFEAVTRHVERQLQGGRSGESLPREAWFVYVLWRFSCEAEGGGLEVFILNDSGMLAPAVHEALLAVGAHELARRLEAAVAIAMRWHPEFR